MIIHWFLTTVICIVCLLTVVFVVSIPLGVAMPDDGSGCVMTRMWPNWITENESSPYRLMRYSDGEDRSSTDPYMRIPIVFVPGNGGSYKQGRSIGHVMSEDPNGIYTLYAVDYIGELSALSGEIFSKQQKYLHEEVVKTIRRLHRLKPTTKIGCIAHSMGGIVASTDVTNWSFVIALATPFAHPPILDDLLFEAAYDSLNKKPDIPIVSVSSGIRDFMVPASQSKHDLFVSTYVRVSDIDARVECDHLSILWCNQVVMFIVKTLLPSEGKYRNEIPEKKLLKTSREKTKCAEFVESDSSSEKSVVLLSTSTVSSKESKQIESVRYFKQISSRVAVSAFDASCANISTSVCFPEGSSCCDDITIPSYDVLFSPTLSVNINFPPGRSCGLLSQHSLPWFLRGLVFRASHSSRSCEKGSNSYFIKNGNKISKRGVILAPDNNYFWITEIIKDTSCDSTITLSPQWAASSWVQFTSNGGVASLVLTVSVLSLQLGNIFHLISLLSLCILLSPVMVLVGMSVKKIFRLLTCIGMALLPASSASKQRVWFVPGMYLFI